MKILLLTAVISFVGTEEPLEKFYTLYIAADNLKLIQENGPLRIYIRHILPHNSYAEVDITFYIRQKDGCQFYTPLLHKFITFIIRPPHEYLMLSDKSRPLQSRSQGGDVSKTVFFMIPDKFSTLPENWVQSIKDESKAKETSLSKELLDIYVRTTTEYRIPRENIRDILKTTPVLNEATDLVSRLIRLATYLSMASNSKM